MTVAAPDQPAAGAGTGDAAGPSTLVLSRAVTPGHEEAFEAVLRRVGTGATAFPRPPGLAVLPPPAGGGGNLTVVAAFAPPQGSYAWASHDCPGPARGP